MAGTAEVAGWKEKLDKVLHEKNSATDLLEKAEKKTGVRRLYIVLGLMALCVVYLLVGYGSQFLCNFIGFLYPAYASVKAIESSRKDDDTQWLVYWTVYSAFSLVEFFADIFLFWIPFYSFLKCMFLVWCMAPQSWNGSITIYNSVIRPFVLKHQDRLDKAMGKATDLAGKAMNEGADLVDDLDDVVNDAAKRAMGFTKQD